MKAKADRPKTILPLIGILLILFLTAIVVWRLFLYNQKSIAEEYQLLASIKPGDIILYQKNNPETWKDYVAVVTACQKDTAVSRNLRDELLSQLNAHTKFENLKWLDANKTTQALARRLRMNLNQYSIYDPRKFGFPLKPTYSYVDTYGADREGGKRFHQGTDLFAKKGTLIYNVCPGRVEKLGWNRLGGERVGVRGDDGNYYYYAHLDAINPQLVVGQKIKTGDLIGKMGNTGDAVSTPDHLHFGIELPNGDWLNPYPFLKVWEYHTFGEAVLSTKK